MKTVKLKDNKLIKKYPYIYAWGKMMGSFNYYIEMQLQKADEENAPANSIYRGNETGKWQTTEGLKKPLIDELDMYIKGIKGGIGI